MVERKRGDVVKAKGRRGKFKLRTKSFGGWWALSERSGKVVPIRDGDIR